MKPHRTDPLSLLAGLAFVAVAVVALLGGIGFDADVDLRWALPALLITLGFALLAGIGRSGDADDATAAGGADDPSAAADRADADAGSPTP